ncbi:glycoside hydrolase family 19 protein [Nocardia spumae]|uniref:glycoside hydrolase family 19 protein n=1 Tax=Nocardia spumae TaxID=2887190 RepID=UPI001D13658C|nr:glycoside hydrolase family 19 protein [Nocardia spumae]
MDDQQAVSTSRIVAEAAAAGRPSPGATSPEAAAPADATICPTYGWTGWTVELSPPPGAHDAVKQLTELVQVVFQAMVDQLGVGDKATVPDVNELLRTTGLSDALDESLVSDAHSATVERIRNIKKGLISQHAVIAAGVATTAKVGTALNRDIWNEVGELRTALHAVGTGKLSARVEVGLLDRLRTSLREMWKKYDAVVGANKSNGDGMGPLTLADLKSLVPKTTSGRLREYLPYLNKAMREAGITNPKREAAFLAQVIHETDQLKTLTEYGDDDYFDSRYGPQTSVGRSLGNTRPGDGSRYPGRGALQITGRSNYREAGKALGIDLEGHPKQAADPEHAFDVAAWYWKSHHLNDDADKSDLDAITREINGGNTGANERRRYYDKAREILDAD